jgi:hypothetical protein
MALTLPLPLPLPLLLLLLLPLLFLCNRGGWLCCWQQPLHH